MLKLDQFNDNLGTAIALTGPAGGGKTVLGCRLFPKTYVYVADLNFSSAKRYLETNNLTGNIVGLDVGAVDDNNKPLNANQRYDRMFKKVSEAIASPEVDAIFLDSATFIEDYIKAKICGAASDAQIKLGNHEHWSMYLMTWKGLITQMRQSGKKLIVSCHEKKEKDESDGIFKYQIALDGQIRDKFPALFSDVWRCETRELNNKHTWHVRLLGNIRQEHLKNTYGLPGEMLADDLVKKIHEINAKCVQPS